MIKYRRECPAKCETWNNYSKNPFAMSAAEDEPSKKTTKTILAYTTISNRSSEEIVSKLAILESQVIILHLVMFLFFVCFSLLPIADH